MRTLSAHAACGMVASLPFTVFLCGILVQLCVSNDLLIVRDLNSVSK